MSNPTAWRKGQSGNPGGRPKLPDATQRLREHARIEAIEAVSQLMTMTRAQIEQTAMDMEAPGALALAASVMKTAMKHGCPHRTQLILSYVIGKPDTAPIEGQADNPDQNTIRLAYRQDEFQ